MARANERRNDEEETGTTARRAGMVFANRQAGRRVKKPGEARGQRQEREKGWMAEGQAAQKNVRNLFFPGRTRPGGVPGGGESGHRSLRNTPLLRELNFWRFLLAQYQ